jgi:hypothetical protein
MLIESSTTIAIAIDAPAGRWSDNREQRTKGVAPSTASTTTAAARVASRERSSSLERRRAWGEASVTRRAGGKICSSELFLRSRCATYGAITSKAADRANTERKVTADR